MSDVIETPLSESVRNHWWRRPGWTEGRHFYDQINTDELGHLDHALTTALAAVEPSAVEFRYLIIQREAVYLKAHPAAALYPLRRAMYDAALSVLGPERFTEPTPDPAKFLPHGHVHQGRPA
jgi:hypothetical protein